MFELRMIDSSYFNEWQSTRHYLKRKMIRSKLLAHGIFRGGELVGGLLWATPHFTKKRNLFGFPNTPDKWEVLMLARFYLIDGCEVIASQALAESIGRPGRKSVSQQRGWRLQEDWVRENPPKFPDRPFVPRLLISWSDTKWGHKGIIYRASGWERWDETTVNYFRTGRGDRQMWRDDANAGAKTCWVMRLKANLRAELLGKRNYVQVPMLECAK